MSAEQDLKEAVTLLDDWLHASSNRLDRIAMHRAREFLARPSICELLIRDSDGNVGPAQEEA